MAVYRIKIANYCDKKSNLIIFIPHLVVSESKSIVF